MEKNVLRIYPDTTVYILCPANLFTGGPTLLHQLASQLLAMGIRAQMVYLPADGKQYVNPVAPEYEKYHLDWTQEICDDEKNILIANEICTAGLYWGKNIRRILWWLSVDNYFTGLRQYINNISMQNITDNPLKKFYYFDTRERIIHWCQSEYARQFIQCNGIDDEDIFMVEDYISQNFLQGKVDLSCKVDMVAFNPRKGLETTKKLMEARPDINWRSIIDMTPAQVKELLLQAKIYIDFGNHPGKDRIPREAALSGCVVITGCRGAAANDIDINIPADFKLPDDNIEGVLAKIDEVFATFSLAYQRQEAYRWTISADYERFVNEVRDALDMAGAKIPVWGAVVNDQDGTGLEIAKALMEMKEDYVLRYIIDDSVNVGNGETQRCYMEFGQEKVEVLNSKDADFLYQEGRINKIFACEIVGRDRLQAQLPALRSEDLLLV